jgi:hypothetical protein
MTISRFAIPDRYLCGWRLRTQLPLPATVPWPDPNAGRPDVTFVLGAVPASLTHPVVDQSVLQIADDGTALVRFDDIGRFLLQGDMVICDLDVPPDAPELTAVIFGNVLTCICWQRGQLPLHGSAVAISDRAVMLLGRAATGKSLLAAALLQRGHSALSDEVAATAGGMCFPAGSALSLADDALMALGIDPTDLPQYWNFPIPKRLWTMGPTPTPRPYPIAAVICLSKAPPDAPNEAQQLDGDAAVSAILNQVYRRDMLRLAHGEARALQEATALVAAAPIYQFPVARSLDRIEEAAAGIERLARG